MLPRYSRVFVLLLVFAVVPLSVATSSANGALTFALDTRFDHDGVVTLPAISGKSGNHVEACSANRDGTLTIVGAADRGDPSRIPNASQGAKYSVMRIGRRGIRRARWPRPHSLGADKVLYAVDINDRGGVTLAFGEGQNVSDRSGAHLSLLRIKHDGAIDRSFGKNGRVDLLLSKAPPEDEPQHLLYTVRITTSRQGSTGIAYSPTQRSSRVAELNRHGRPRRGFGSNGWKTFKRAAIDQISFDKEHLLVLGGFGSRRLPKIYSFEPSGRRDRSFGADGVLRLLGSRSDAYGTPVGFSVLPARELLLHVRGNDDPAEYITLLYSPTGRPLNRRPSWASPVVYQEPYAGDSGFPDTSEFKIVPAEGGFVVAKVSGSYDDAHSEDGVAFSHWLFDGSADPVARWFAQFAKPFVPEDITSSRSGTSLFLCGSKGHGNRRSHVVIRKYRLDAAGTATGITRSVSRP